MKNIEKTRLHLKRDGYVFDFERFPIKTVKGILNRYAKFAKESTNPELFLESYHHADKIEIIDSMSEEVLGVFTPETFFRLIGYNRPRRKTDSDFFRYDSRINGLQAQGKIVFAD